MPQEYLTIPAFEPYPFGFAYSRRMRPLSVGALTTPFIQRGINITWLRILCKGISEKNVSSVAREAIHTREEIDPTRHSGHGLNCLRTSIQVTLTFGNWKFSYNWTIECGLLFCRFNATGYLAELCTLRGGYFSIRDAVVTRKRE